ncbi:MAG: hypothetical protein JW904_01590 [Spirochaetales bacterium]|nr:hypothetical protein [Spirochaetales bacterium]
MGIKNIPDRFMQFLIPALPGLSGSLALVFFYTNNWIYIIFAVLTIVSFAVCSFILALPTRGFLLLVIVPYIVVSLIVSIFINPYLIGLVYCFLVFYVVLAGLLLFQALTRKRKEKNKTSN